MKKFFAICILLIVLLLPLAACSDTSLQASQSPAASGAVLKGKIVNITNSSCLIADSTSAELYAVTTKLDIFDIDKNKADASALKSGQTVEVGYSGLLLETYPASPSKPAYIRITGQGDDLVGFYKTVLDDLWNRDEGLNPKSGMLAFDLTQVANLNEAEKGALVYLVSNAHGLQGITGTFDELAEKGLIDKQNLSFKNGMLFTIKLTNVTESSFTFDVSKWRGGTGADFLNDCKAVKKDGNWSYTVGSSAIA